MYHSLEHLPIKLLLAYIGLAICYPIWASGLLATLDLFRDRPDMPQVSLYAISFTGACVGIAIYWLNISLDEIHGFINEDHETTWRMFVGGASLIMGCASTMGYLLHIKFFPS